MTVLKGYLILFVWCWKKNQILYLHIINHMQYLLKWFIPLNVL